MPGREYLLRVSYLEIYKERLHDLLDRSASANLQIRENSVSCVQRYLTVVSLSILFEAMKSLFAW